MIAVRGGTRHPTLMEQAQLSFRVTSSAGLEASQDRRHRHCAVVKVFIAIVVIAIHINHPLWWQRQWSTVIVPDQRTFSRCLALNTNVEQRHERNSYRERQLAMQPKVGIHINQEKNMRGLYSEYGQEDASDICLGPPD